MTRYFTSNDSIVTKVSYEDNAHTQIIPLMWAWLFFFQSSARVESLGTALASTTLQAKPAWARVRLNKFLNVYN